MYPFNQSYQKRSNVHKFYFYIYKVKKLIFIELQLNINVIIKYYQLNYNIPKTSLKL